MQSSVGRWRLYYGITGIVCQFAKPLLPNRIYQTTSANRPVPNNICQTSILTLADPRTKHRDPGTKSRCPGTKPRDTGTRPRGSGTKWSHFLCHTFMGRVVLADGGLLDLLVWVYCIYGFLVWLTRITSLLITGFYTDVSQSSFYLKLVVQRILYLVFFVKSKIFKDFFWRYT